MAIVVSYLYISENITRITATGNKFTSFIITSIRIIKEKKHGII